MSQLTFHGAIIDTRELTTRYPTANPQDFRALNCITLIVCSRTLPAHLGDLVLLVALMAGAIAVLPANLSGAPLWIRPPIQSYPGVSKKHFQPY